MATLKLTDQLKSEIMGKIEDKFSPQIEECSKTIKAESVNLTWQVFWSEPLLEHVEKIKHEIAHHTDICLDVMLPSGVSHQVDIPLSTTGPIPKSMPCGRWSRLKVMHNDPRFKTYLEKVVPALQRRADIIGECNTFQTEVRQVLDKFPTLNKAIKSWPALEALVPQERLQKLREKTQREKAETATVDSQDLNTTLLKLSVMS